jgi:DNA-binding MarR family transcriptional regulator
MQQMQSAINDDQSPEACASLLLEVAPLVMRTVRTHMRGHRAVDLSVPQFRALGYVHRHPGVSLSDLANHIGLTLPAASRLVNGLVSRQYMLRQPAAADRRSVDLTVSAKGRAMLDLTWQATHAHLTAVLQPLSAGERETLAHALETLRALFSARGERDLEVAVNVSAQAQARQLPQAPSPELDFVPFCSVTHGMSKLNKYRTR